MSPRTAALSALTIGGGLALAASNVTAMSAAEPLSPQQDQPVIAESVIWTALDDITRSEFDHVAVAAADQAGDASPYATPETDSGQAVPLHDFRVGPFFGAVGGPHTGGVHSGLDLGADQGQPIFAVEGGKVIVADWQGAAGKAVTIKTADGKSILYGHMSSIAVEQGDKVETGHKLGKVGSTGNSTGPHLHLGVTKPNGELMDPLVWMDLSAKQLRQFSN